MGYLFYLTIYRTDIKKVPPCLPPCLPQSQWHVLSLFLACSIADVDEGFTDVDGGLTTH